MAVGPSSYGQSQTSCFTLLDSKTAEPVAFANVCTEGLHAKVQKHYVTTMEGTFPNEIKERSAIAISCVGYITLRDTLSPGTGKVLRLIPTVFNINEVVITGQYSPERADKSIYKVDVINSRQIENKAANTMAELLNDQVNMRVSQGGVLGTSLSMQGLSGENVKFLVDGVPMIGRMDGNIDLNTIVLTNVDHVEIIEGPMSVIYGSNALAGVINVITKENKKNRLTAYVNSYLESVGAFNFSGGASANFGSHGVSFTGGRNFFGGYTVPGLDHGRAQTYKPRRQYFFSGYYMFTHRNLKIKLAGQYFNEYLQDKGNLLPPYFETAFDSYFTTMRYNMHLDMYLNLPRKHYLTFMGAYSSYSRIKEKYYKDLTNMNEIQTTNPDDQDTTDMASWVSRITYSKNNNEKRLNFQSGFDFNNESGSGKRILDHNQVINDFALFGSLKWDLIPSLSLQPGIRLIYNSKFNAPVVYALSGRYAFNDCLSLRLSYSKGFRSPAIKELYLYFMDVNHNVQGNQNLGSETSNNANVNLNYTRESRRYSWSADLSGFYNHVKNNILLAQADSNSTLYTYINVDQYNALSSQLNLSFFYYPALTIRMGFSETGRNYHFDDQNQNTSFYFTPDFSTNVSYQFIGPAITLALNYKYTGKTPQFLVEKSSITEGYIDPYHSMDFTAMKGLFNNMLTISTGVKNIFNVTTVGAAGVSGGAHTSSGDAQAIGWGRTLFLKLSYNFNKTK